MIPSPAEIIAARTKRGGWTKATLKKWGVGWPPTRGWKAKLEQAWFEAQNDSALPESAVTTSVHKPSACELMSAEDFPHTTEQDFPNLIPLEWYLPD